MAMENFSSVSQDGDGACWCVSSSCKAAATMGEDVLGFSTANIGCHSICAACAIAIYLDRLGVATIMLIGIK